MSTHCGNGKFSCSVTRLHSPIVHVYPCFCNGVLDRHIDMQAVQKDGVSPHKVYILVLAVAALAVVAASVAVVLC